MTYDFRNLFSADFEDLVRDLIGKELGVRFEAFCAGPDGGIDGRHAPAGGNGFVLQAKHYEGSSFAKLVNAMKKERKSIDALSPSRYLLATSCKFTPDRKSKLAKIIGSSLLSESDIFGPEDLNGLLRAYPDILKSHIKLWLSGTGVLERVLRASAAAFTSMTIEEIEQKVRVYATNPSFDASLDTLAKHHVLIISGPPGVGKTTLAEMLCYTYLSEDWDLVPIRSLEDGLAAIDDSKQQIFYFDDFLGRVALDKQALAHRDSDLARFMSRVKRSANARFILTTRGYIFEEARRVSEHLADTRLDVSKYVLDVGIYTRRIKARILHNHLLVSGTKKTYIKALLDSNFKTAFGIISSLSRIIDHKNYNPRVIEYMTDNLRIREISPHDYPKAFLAALDNPSQIWDTAFRTHIDHKCRHLLITMFFTSEFGVDIADLRKMFESTHKALSVHYGLPHGPKDYEESLKILEGSFIGIHKGRASYINPSLKDYLTGYLSDPEFLALIAPTAKTVTWIRLLWSFVRGTLLEPDDQKRIAHACINLLDMVESRPTWQPAKNEPGILVQADAPISTRIKLLIEWWRATNEVKFADRALAIARNPTQGFDAWRDSDQILDILLDAEDPEYGHKFLYVAELRESLEEHLANLVRWQMRSNDLANFADAIDTYSGQISDVILSALAEAVSEEFDEIGDRVDQEDSESSLVDHIDVLKKLAPRYGISEQKLSYAISKIEDRISEIEEKSTPSSSPTFLSQNREIDAFDDHALRNMFTPLLED